MKAAISINHARHQADHGEAMRAGLLRHGVEVVFTPGDKPVDDADFHATWSVKRPRIFDWRRRTGRPILVMERGYLPDRFVYTSCGWNGLNGRATFPRPDDAGARWRERFAHWLRPWKHEGNYVLVCGQVPGDAALYGLDLDKWAADTCRAARDRFSLPVRFRPHPLTVRQGRVKCPTAAELSTAATLAEDLENAFACITYTSNSGVESVLAGVPTIAMDEGSMAWDVASHSVDPSLVRPDRTAWGHQLAFCQWMLEEIATGDAWEHLRQGLNA